jgi:hypothetical protein
MYENVPLLKGTSPYSCFEGVPVDKSRASPPVARREWARNILFMDEKIFTIEEQYNNQNNKFYAETSLEVCSKCVGGSSSFLYHGLVEGVPSVGDTSSFLRERSETGA